MDIKIDIFMTLLATAYTLVVAIYFLTLQIIRKRKKDFRKEQYETLQKCILNDTVYDAFGVELFCKTSSCVDFETFVRKFLKYSLNNLNISDFKKVDQFMRTIVIEKQKEKPFETCNPIDKQCILTIIEAIDKSNEAALHGIKELAKRMVERDSVLHNQERKQKILTWITIVGLIINIIFGVLSVVQSNKYSDSKKEQVVEKM